MSLPILVISIISSSPLATTPDGSGFLSAVFSCAETVFGASSLSSSLEAGLEPLVSIYDKMSFLVTRPSFPEPAIASSSA